MRFFCLQLVVALMASSAFSFSLRSLRPGVRQSGLGGVRRTCRLRLLSSATANTNNQAANQAITPRDEDYSAWYGDVIRHGSLAESSPSRGAMVIKVGVVVVDHLILPSCGEAGGGRQAAGGRRSQLCVL